MVTHETNEAPSEADVLKELPQNKKPICPANGEYFWTITSVPALSISIICNNSEGPIKHGKFNGSWYYDGSDEWNSK